MRKPTSHVGCENFQQHQLKEWRFVSIYMEIRGRLMSILFGQMSHKIPLEPQYHFRVHLVALFKNALAFDFKNSKIIKVGGFTKKIKIS